MDNNSNTFFILNIPPIDTQHQKFFEMWDEYTKSELPTKGDELNELIEKLENYLKMHFRFEESLMRESGYENIDEHIKEHVFFINKIKEFRIDQGYMNTVLFEKIVVFIKKWFLSHILKSDKLYQNTVSKYLNSK